MTFNKQILPQDVIAKLLPVSIDTLLHPEPKSTRKEKIQGQVIDNKMVFRRCTLVRV